MRIAPGFIRVISSPNTYTPSLLQQASGSPQDEGYFPIIIRVIFKFVLIPALPARLLLDRQAGVKLVRPLTELVRLLTDSWSIKFVLIREIRGPYSHTSNYSGLFCKRQR